MNLDQPPKSREPLFETGQRVRSNDQFDARVHEGVVQDVKYVPTRGGGIASILRVLVDHVDGRLVPPSEHECAGFCWEPVVPLAN